MSESLTLQFDFSDERDNVALTPKTTEGDQNITT